MIVADVWLWGFGRDFLTFSQNFSRAFLCQRLLKSYKT